MCRFNNYQGSYQGAHHNFTSVKFPSRYDRGRIEILRIMLGNSDCSENMGLSSLFYLSLLAILLTKVGI